MIVIKFGGTSVSTKERIKTICEIVKKENERKPVVVVSAIRGVTDLLLDLQTASKNERIEIYKKIELLHTKLINDEENENLMKEYLDECLNKLEKILSKKQRSKKISDEIVSYGEKMSSFVISNLLNSSGISSQQVLSTELIVTNEDFSNAEFIPAKTIKKTKKQIIPLLNKNIVPVVPGFIGKTENGQITTLGRGGSDYSAAILGYALHASEVQIWTDVDGIFTADPRIVKSAKYIEKLTYKEVSELAAFGAKVLHPRTIRPLVSKNIPVVIKNTLNPKAKGTYVNGFSVVKPRVAAIASKSVVTLVNIYSAEMLLQRGFLEKIFSIFARHNISVDLVSVSEVSVSVTLDNNDDLKNALKELEAFANTTTSQVGVVSLIGQNILESKDILINVFSILNSKKIPVRMLSLGASDINISIVLDTNEVMNAVKLLHNGIITRNQEVI